MRGQVSWLLITTALAAMDYSLAKQYISEPQCLELEYEEVLYHKSPSIKNSTTLNNEKAPESTKLKDGFNYASFDCGAVVRTSNKEAKNPTAILLNAKDAYLLSPCSTDIFVEFELCQDILVRGITLANFEYFSSMFKDFEVYGSSIYPPDWKLLGSFVAKNSRDRQYFTVQNPVIWVKYIKIAIKSHYGNEYYCPLTSVQVFGTSMMDDAKEYQELKNEDPMLLTNATKSKNLEPTSVSTATAPLNFVVASTCPDTPHTQQEEIDFSATISPTPAKQDSIFSKIIQRISLLEKAAQDLTVDLQEFKKIYSSSQKDLGSSLEKIESKIQKTVSLMVFEVNLDNRTRGGVESCFG
jgi:hypothetical protein